MKTVRLAHALALAACLALAAGPSPAQETQKPKKPRVRQAKASEMETPSIEIRADPAAAEPAKPARPASKKASKAAPAEAEAPSELELGAFEEGCIVANRSSKRYYLPTERYYAKAKTSKNAAFFKTAEDAEEAGYKGTPGAAAKAAAAPAAEKAPAPAAEPSGPPAAYTMTVDDPEPAPAPGAARSPGARAGKPVPGALAAYEPGCAIGNRKSKKYHLPGGRYYEQSRDSKNAVFFKTAADAEKAGYTRSAN